MAVARLVVDEWLHERRPAADVADWLVCRWRGDLGNAELPLPGERLDLVWVDDGTLWLSGPETTSWSRGYPPGTTAVGVGFNHGSARRCCTWPRRRSATPGSALRSFGGIATPRSLPSASRPIPMAAGGHGNHAGQAAALR
jgi:hypothetical protein